jgi:hypothetical protein
LGGPCSCSDLSSDNRPTVCVNGGWSCPTGYTRLDACRGVPPGPECHDAGIAEADGSMNPDVASEAQGTSPCDLIDASMPQCLRGGPCSCDDQANDNGVPICTDSGWTCPAGFTRFEDCHGVPPMCDAF